ncbi:formate dehydrogenase accessory sulfurtransferase FdhD [Marininema halotolerans]|uniref:formate dehydrogenase accessory sulfurtransferase FdhD n=1 Tax=Marininema halotolerans TaxID=1155944 RepID=UPI001FE744D1|nr:formate dehydrogenase accessory sulfurtransferase FdhD [Marininema halotolerans]
MTPPHRSQAPRRKVHQVRQGQSQVHTDSLAGEEPLEIRLTHPSVRDPISIAVTMRTPGDDFDLAAGFLFTEGILPSREAIHSITYCRDPKVDGEQRYNIVNVNVYTDVSLHLEHLTRHFYTSSSCGVCGKASLEAIEVRGIQALPDGFTTTDEIIYELGNTLRLSQSVFEKTGGIHAAGWFDGQGNLLALREDIGRHNAVDKLLGHAFLHKHPPLSQGILMVSGRTSFEILQKAAVAGIPIVVAVSAPSSLAYDLAHQFNITLIGFAREGRFNIYTGGHRILLKGSNH